MIQIEPAQRAHVHRELAGGSLLCLRLAAGYTSDMLNDQAILRGTLHVFLAFDWGDEINLEHARKLLPAESQDLRDGEGLQARSTIGRLPCDIRWGACESKFPRWAHAMRRRKPSCSISAA